MKEGTCNAWLRQTHRGLCPGSELSEPRSCKDTGTKRETAKRRHPRPLTSSTLRIDTTSFLEAPSAVLNLRVVADAPRPPTSTTSPFQVTRRVGMTPNRFQAFSSSRRFRSFSASACNISRRASSAFCWAAIFRLLISASRRFLRSLASSSGALASAASFATLAASAASNTMRQRSFPRPRAMNQQSMPSLVLSLASFPPASSKTFSVSE